MSCNSTLLFHLLKLHNYSEFINIILVGEILNLRCTNFVKHLTIQLALRRLVFSYTELTLVDNLLWNFSFSRLNFNLITSNSYSRNLSLFRRNLIVVFFLIFAIVAMKLKEKAKTCESSRRVSTKIQNDKWLLLLLSSTSEQTIKSNLIAFKHKSLCTHSHNFNANFPFSVDLIFHKLYLFLVHR